MQFNIKKGMTDAEIRAEWKGRISGETRQEVQQLLVPKNMFRVVDDNGEYALVATGDKYSLKYFLTGVNDEGKYFVRQLTEEALSKPLDELIDWIHRRDEGYSLRIQGDVLLQFHSVTGRQIMSMHFRSQVSAQGRIFEEYQKLLESLAIGLRVPTGTIYREVRVRYLLNNSFWDTNPDELWTQRIVALNLGNHKLTASGTILTQGQMIIVDGDNLVLQHPEHGLKTVDIPKGHYASLAGQRGRSLATQIMGTVGSTLTMGGFD